MTAESFYYPLSIKESYLDTFGHVNNAVYLTLFEEARWALLNQSGFGIAKFQETGLGPTILEIKLTFLKELRLHDAIVIETHLVSYEKKIGRLFQRMLRGEEVCCTAEIMIGLFDLRHRKLVLPTPEWLQAIGFVVSTD